MKNYRSLMLSATYVSDLETAAEHSADLEKLQEKSVLITGATGTIGSFLVDMLLHYNQTNHAKIHIYALGRSIERLEKRFGNNSSENLTLIQQNLLEPIAFHFRVDYIIHAAGNSYPAAFNEDPVGTIMGNIFGTYSLLKYGKMCGAQRLLYISSGEIYGQGDLSMESFPENYSGFLDTTAPRSCYPMSKRVAETLCASYSKQFDLETVIVRPCHTYGPGMTQRDNRAHVQFIRNALSGQDIVMKSAGTQMRSYCYIADCAAAIFTVLLNGVSGEAYNSANSDARITIRGLAEIIAAEVGKKVVFLKPEKKDLAERTPISKQVLDTRKIESLGWKGQYSVENGIGHTLAILRETWINDTDNC